MTEHPIGHDDLECLYILQRRVDAGQGTERDLALLRERNDGGFHWKFDTYFKRLPDGSVRIRIWRCAHDGFPTYDDRVIDEASWASIVCSVSAEGETGERWNAARDFHGRLSASPPSLARPAMEGWEPIETAPKDSTIVDLWVAASGVPTGYRVPNARRIFDGGKWPDVWVNVAGRYVNYSTYYDTDEEEDCLHLGNVAHPQAKSWTEATHWRLPPSAPSNKEHSK